jgi:glycoside/pentoside/hexuronide:cation symporter, GPH family
MALATSDENLQSAPGWVRATGYASGNFGKNILWSAADLTLFFLLTDVLDVAPATAGFLLLGSLCVNAVLDPFMGAIADRLRSPFGRNGTLILIGSPICATAFALLYGLPALGVRSVAIVTLVIIAFRVGYAVIDAPHNAILASMGGNARQRGLLSGLRFLFSSLANLAIIGVVPSIAAARDSGETETLAWAALIVGALSASAMVIAAWAARPWDKPEQKWGFDSKAWKVRSRGLVSTQIVEVLCLILVANTGVPIFAKMILYHANYIVGDAVRSQQMLVAMVLGQILGIAPWTLLVRWFSPFLTLSLAFLGVALASIAMSVTGGITATGDMVVACVFGLSAGGVYTLIWLPVANCADAFERRNGFAAAGMIFALSIVAIKLGQGLGAVLTGQVLSWSGYVPKLSTAAEIGPTIRGLQSGAPIVASVMCILIIALSRSRRDVGQTPSTVS